MIMRYLAILFTLLFPLSTMSFPADAGEKVGVVLMHGKNGTAREKSPIGKLVYQLEVADFIVVAPDMPWSRSRGFDRTYAESMAESDEAVAILRDKGATKIVVGGHSLGASAALGYLHESGLIPNLCGTSLHSQERTLKHRPLDLICGL